jgi:hypothetical protein
MTHPKRHRLEDGTTWPVAEAVAEAAYRCRYEHKDYDAAEACDALLHLMTHPVGTEATILKLRMLRRAHRRLTAPAAPPPERPR